MGESIMRSMSSIGSWGLPTAVFNRLFGELESFPAKMNVDVYVDGALVKEQHPVSLYKNRCIFGLHHIAEVGPGPARPGPLAGQATHTSPRPPYPPRLAPPLPPPPLVPNGTCAGGKGGAPFRSQACFPFPRPPPPPRWATRAT
jgi:hypothetical protein